MVCRPYKRCWVRAKVFDLGSFRGNDAIGQGENRHAHWSECCDRDSCNTVTYNIIIYMQHWLRIAPTLF